MCQIGQSNNGQQGETPNPIKDPRGESLRPPIAFSWVNLMKIREFVDYARNESGTVFGVDAAGWLPSRNLLRDCRSTAGREFLVTHAPERAARSAGSGEAWSSLRMFSSEDATALSL